MKDTYITLLIMSASFLGFSVVMMNLISKSHYVTNHVNVKTQRSLNILRSSKWIKYGDKMCHLLEYTCLVSTYMRLIKSQGYTLPPDPQFIGVFFNVLLHTISFKNEKDLFLDTNKEKSYIRECHNREIISNLDIIQEHLLEYAYCNLINTKKRVQLL